ncbi:alcohol dehydrogenase catalytic domain-containing protein [Kribbella caucasensis]|uniref:alcohol dehydrogenase catalytic domain-containing protein n=1 Tax=Kribbella caucasensis TaxID=2512215 RepID=UPI003519E8CE
MRATWLATSLPWSLRTRCRQTSIPEAAPAEVSTSPSSTNRTSGVSEILVAVHAAGVNPTDWKNRAQATTIAGMPLVLGWDVSGVVEAVGIGVTLSSPATRSSGCCPIPAGWARTPST